MECTDTWSRLALTVNSAASRQHGPKVVPHAMVGEYPEHVESGFQPDR